MISEKQIGNLEELIGSVRRDYLAWQTTTFPWFRGEPNNTDTPLLPKLYRKKPDGSTHNENRLLQQFRMKAPSLASISTPIRSHTDEWLFLAQHVGLPTRLLDWTEGLFIALHFALLEEEPVIWMLDPIELCRLSSIESIADNVFSLTWLNPEKNLLYEAEAFEVLRDMLIAESREQKNQIANKLAEVLEARRRPNLGNINIRGAWESNRVGSDFPVAIHPTNVHSRMSSQRSCFTIHGKRQESLDDMVSERILKKYIIQRDAVDAFRSDMKIVGVTHSSVFPDLDHLAKELSEIY